MARRKCTPHSIPAMTVCEEAFLRRPRSTYCQLHDKEPSGPKSFILSRCLGRRYDIVSQAAFPSCARRLAFRRSTILPRTNVTKTNRQGQLNSTVMQGHPVAPQAPQPRRYVKYYIQRITTNVNHVLFYVVDEEAQGKLAIVVGRAVVVVVLFATLSSGSRGGYGKRRLADVHRQPHGTEACMP